MEHQNISNMRKQFLLAFLIFICFRSVAQNTDSIVYVLHFDSVETKIDQHLSALEKRDVEIMFWGYLGRCDAGFKLVICNTISDNDSEDSFLHQLRKNTNRFLLIDKRKIPLILDYDSVFSTPKITSIGSLGQRDGNVLRNRFILDCFTIVFDEYGKIIQIINEK